MQRLLFMVAFFVFGLVGTASTAPAAEKQFLMTDRKQPGQTKNIRSQRVPDQWGPSREQTTLASKEKTNSPQDCAGRVACDE